jgi:hypothetical protein
LEKFTDRSVILFSAAIFAAALSVMTLISNAYRVTWIVLLVIWAVFGFANSGVLTSSGRLLRRSDRDEDLSSLFAAQFALSHTCFLVTYPLVGWLRAELDMTAALTGMTLFAAFGTSIATRLWPASPISPSQSKQSPDRFFRLQP